MAAIRLGSFLSNVQGTSKQILRINELETGFEFVSSPELPAYTITNDTTDRTLDALNTTADEMANVLSTLIKDMASIYDGGINSFQWSTSEQVWPFEKASDGATLYCKEVDFGALPNNGNKTVAHNISGFINTKLHRLEGHIYGSDGSVAQLTFAHPTANTSIRMLLTSTNISVLTAINWSTHTGLIRLFYKK